MEGEARKVDGTAGVKAVTCKIEKTANIMKKLILRVIEQLLKIMVIFCPSQ
jgi:hypothetical protein